MAVRTKAPPAAGARPSHAELLRKHRPILLWDSQDDFRAMKADSIAENPGNVLEAKDRVVAGANGEGGVQLSLALLASAPQGTEFDREARFKEAPYPFVAARRMQQEQRLADRVYGRVVERDGDVYLQYWMWLYYNPKHLLGMGRHEGDWEMVQLALDARTHEPRRATYAQHGRGELSNDVSGWKPCDVPCSPACLHPEVYVAPFSHASYHERGTHFYLVGTDNPDGAVRGELPEVELLDECSWKDWPGRWGQQRGLLGSPRSPGCQPEQWDPETFERKATRRTPLSESRLWRLGSSLYPEAPEIETATIRGDTVHVKWRVHRKLGLRPTWLLLTVHGSSGGVIRRRIVRVTTLEGETRVPLAERPTTAIKVQGSTFNGLRQRSEVSPSRQAAFADDPAVPEHRDEFTPAVLKAFHRELLRDLRDHGAASLQELRARKAHVLELALDERELAAVVDSARRAGLVAPLGQAKRADGSGIDKPEWAPTEEGQRRIMPFRKWLLRAVGVLPLAGLIALLKPLSPLIKKLGDDNRWAFGVAALLVVVVLGRSLYHGLSGASNRVIARQWSRHAVELPLYNRYLTWWTPGRVWIACAGVLAYVTDAVLIEVVPRSPSLALAVAMGVLGAFGLITMIVVYISTLARAVQVASTKEEAKALREDAASPLQRAAGAVRELRPAKRRRRRRRR